ncbi:sulfatase [Haloferula sp. A504]|uniref:sulfatase n=1 Tax=Haloferula sp. A504 TaxID=3373601 RepID=UPI0031C28D01|nr:sulfatase [Verrucomicrobiaceae bacterium E54]
MKSLLLLLCLPVSALAAARAPNIVFILADDLGITDIGAYARHFNEVGRDELFYETPHLDRLVGDGIAFSQSYANQLCTPTRAAILTGRIASRMGVTTATPNTRTYYNQGMQPPKGADPHDAFGHKDAIRGNRPWINAHSNTALDPSIPSWPKVLATHDSAFLGKWHLGGHGAPDCQPSVHGFEELAYFDAGGSPYFKWRPLWNRTKPHYPTMPAGYRAGKAGEPTGKGYLTDDLSARAVNFLRSRRNRDRPFLLYYCPFAVHTPFQAPPGDVKRFAKTPQRGHLGRTNEVYAAMLKRLDDSVGEIRSTLDETGLAENTVLIFTSDNGGVEYTQPPATNNLPFKGGKACLYEGGVRVPTVVWQPGRFEGGLWSRAVVDCTDFLPTVAELTANPAPGGIDGRSMLPLLENPAAPGPERTLIWHYPFNVQVRHPDHGQPLSPHSAIRVGDHKLIWNWHGRLELYDIPADPGEKRNLSDEMPELTERLHDQLKTWLKENVAPRYWPRRNPEVSAEAAGGPFPFRDLR